MNKELQDIREEAKKLEDHITRDYRGDNAEDHDLVILDLIQRLSVATEKIEQRLNRHEEKPDRMPWPSPFQKPR
jgi:hypothetical protein